MGNLGQSSEINKNGFSFKSAKAFSIKYFITKREKSGQSARAGRICGMATIPDFHQWNSPILMKVWMKIEISPLLCRPKNFFPLKDENPET